MLTHSALNISTVEPQRSLFTHAQAPVMNFAGTKGIKPSNPADQNWYLLEGTALM